MKEQIMIWLAWKLPPQVLLWAVIRGFADATTGKYSNTTIDDIKYKDVYLAIVEKYKIKCECGEVH